MKLMDQQCSQNETISKNFGQPFQNLLAGNQTEFKKLGKVEVLLAFDCFTEKLMAKKIHCSKSS